MKKIKQPIKIIFTDLMFGALIGKFRRYKLNECKEFFQILYNSNWDEEIKSFINEYGFTCDQAINIIKN